MVRISGNFSLREQPQHFLIFSYYNIYFCNECLVYKRFDWCGIGRRIKSSRSTVLILKIASFRYGNISCWYGHGVDYSRFYLTFSSKLKLFDGCGSRRSLVVYFPNRTDRNKITGKIKIVMKRKTEQVALPRAETHANLIFQLALALTMSRTSFRCSIVSRCTTIVQCMNVMECFDTCWLVL